MKFNICDEVFFFNTASCQIEKAEIKGIQVIPTGISKDTEGKNKLDGSIVVYSMVNGPVLAETEVFGTKEECIDHYLEVLNGLKG